MKKLCSHSTAAPEGSPKPLLTPPPRRREAKGLCFTCDTSARVRLHIYPSWGQLKRNPPFPPWRTTVIKRRRTMRWKTIFWTEIFGIPALNRSPLLWELCDKLLTPFWSGKRSFANGVGCFNCVSGSGFTVGPLRRSWYRACGGVCHPPDPG